MIISGGKVIAKLSARLTDRLGWHRQKVEIPSRLGAVKSRESCAFGAATPPLSSTFRKTVLLHCYLGEGGRLTNSNICIRHEPKNPMTNHCRKIARSPTASDHEPVRMRIIYAGKFNCSQVFFRVTLYRKNS